MAKTSENILTSEQENSIELENRKWRHRRRMSYISLYTVIIQLILCFVFIFLDGMYGYNIIDKFNEISMFLGSVNLGLISLVGAYFGFSTWKEK